MHLLLISFQTESKIASKKIQMCDNPEIVSLLATPNNNKKEIDY